LAYGSIYQYFDSKDDLFDEFFEKDKATAKLLLRDAYAPLDPGAGYGTITAGQG
jgi:AcrR family transcriptional regulator